MKENSVQIRFKEDPVLLDKILQDMQNRLWKSLSGLIMHLEELTSL